MNCTGTSTLLAETARPLKVRTAQIIASKIADVWKNGMYWKQTFENYKNLP
jgi:hypothetical protein